MKRAIAGKRGSVRGVPPEHLVPFIEGPEDPDAWREAFELLKAGALFCLMVIVVALIWIVVWALDWEMPE
jgi:hypothetical protein